MEEGQRREERGRKVRRKREREREREILIKRAREKELIRGACSTRFFLQSNTHYVWGPQAFEF